MTDTYPLARRSELAVCLFRPLVKEIWGSSSCEVLGCLNLPYNEDSGLDMPSA